MFLVVRGSQSGVLFVLKSLVQRVSGGLRVLLFDTKSLVPCVSGGLRVPKGHFGHESVA